MVETPWWPHAVDEATEPVPSSAKPSSPLGSLVYRRAIYSRNMISWCSVRSWSHSVRKTDIASFKQAKASVDQAVLQPAVDEVAATIRCILGQPAGWMVTTVPVGHSRRPDSFAVQLAQGVADRLSVDFEKVFEDRYVDGVSHPKEFSKLPPLRRLKVPTTPAIIVDDIATSGSHLEESVTHIRGLGVPVIAFAWISGSVR